MEKKDREVGTQRRQAGEKGRHCAVLIPRLYADVDGKWWKCLRVWYNGFVLAVSSQTDSQIRKDRAVMTTLHSCGKCCLLMD